MSKYLLQSELPIGNRLSKELQLHYNSLRFRPNFAVKHVLNCIKQPAHHQPSRFQESDDAKSQNSFAIAGLHTAVEQRLHRQACTAEGDRSKTCTYDRILPANDGDALALFRSEYRFKDARNFTSPEEFVLFRNIPHDQIGEYDIDSNATIVGGVPLRLRPINWDHGKLQFRIGAARLGTLAPHKPLNIEQTSIPEVWKNFEISATRNGSLDELFLTPVIAEATAISRTAGYVRRGVVLTQEVHFVAVDLARAQMLRPLLSAEAP